MSITLKRAMKILEGEPWTIGTEKGEGWLFYFDGEKLHEGSRGEPLDSLLDREVVELYEREERKRLFKDQTFMELKSGFAFIVKGRQNGTI